MLPRYSRSEVSVDNAFILDDIVDEPLSEQLTKEVNDWFTKEAADNVEIKRKQEAELLNVFKKNPSKETFMPLYQSYKPLIYKAARGNFFGSPLPQSAHMAQAAQSFMDSIRTWKPNLAPFHIHAYTTVFNKGKRLNLKYQNIGYIPEERATKYQLFNNTITLLKDQLGRDPSAHEIADEIKWSVKDVNTMQKEVRKDRLMDEGRAEGFAMAKSDATVQAARDIMYSLIPQHQVVLEHVMGFNDKPVALKSSGGVDMSALSKATNLSVPKIRSALKTITRKMKAYRGDVSVGNEEE
jgi:hypothetical protein